MTNRYAIIGSSPNCMNTPNLHRLILSSITIGMNRTLLRGFPLDHWVVWDTHDMLEDPVMAACVRKMRRYAAQPWFRDTDVRDKLPPFTPVNWFKDATADGPWYLNDPEHGTVLPCASNACTTAAALAYMLGADEIWLVGIDFATPGPTPDWTEEALQTQARFVNQFFADFPIPVYKTYNGGPLDLEYREYGR